jgi:CBS domain-containing protein
MTREPFTVRLDTNLKEAVRLMVDKKISSLPVVNGSELVGIFTEVDALRVLLEVLPKEAG